MPFLYPLASRLLCQTFLVPLRGWRLKRLVLVVSAEMAAQTDREAAPTSPTSPQSAKTNKEQMEEEARKHLKDLEAHVQIKSREELKEAAKMHRDKNACTEFDETTGRYKYKSCCGTGASELGVFGVGVSLYFQFIRQMGLVFLLCAIVVGANSALNIMGNMVNENSALYKYLGMTTIGNMGACEGGRCQTDEEVQSRCAWNQFPCEVPLKDVTQWLGLADGLGILIVLAWGILFQRCHIPRVVRKNDDAHLTPPDFAVDITVLPYKLADGHEQYEQKLKQHFISILHSLGIEDPSAVAEVCLVRNYDGAISTFLKKGNLLLSQHGDIIRMKEREEKSTVFAHMFSASWLCFSSHQTAIGSTGWFDFSVKYVFPPAGIGRKRRCCEQEKLCQLGEERYQKVHPDETHRAQHQNTGRDE